MKMTPGLRLKYLPRYKCDDVMIVLGQVRSLDTANIRVTLGTSLWIYRQENGTKMFLRTLRNIYTMFEPIEEVLEPKVKWTPWKRLCEKCGGLVYKQNGTLCSVCGDDD